MEFYQFIKIVLKIIKKNQKIMFIIYQVIRYKKPRIGEFRGHYSCRLLYLVVIQGWGNY
jgi:hypothetical protein